MITFERIKKFLSKNKARRRSNNVLDEIDSLISRIREKREELDRKRIIKIDRELNNNH